jgi:putative oxidoreductase
MKNAWDVKWRIVLRYVVGALFVWAAISKVANLQEFYVSLRAYQLPLPNIILQWVAVTLPWLELLCGLLLLAGFWLRAATGWALILCAVFALCTGQAWLRGLTISCGCLNLSMLGLSADEHPTLIAFLESVGFAFFRALLLCLACWWLLRWFVHRRRFEESAF